MATYLGKKLFIRFRGQDWDMIVSVPDHGLSFYFRFSITA